MPLSVPARPAPRIPRYPGLFVLAAALAVLGLIGTYLYFVRTSTGQYIDESALIEAPLIQQSIGEQASYILDTLPVASIVISGCLVLGIAIVRKRWFAACIAVVTAVGANLTSQFLKSALPDRPFRGISTLDLNSLPSGHTTLAASAAAAVFLVSSPRWRPLVAFLGGTYSIISGSALLINQWHRPADVLAAYLVVSAWAAIGGWLVLRQGRLWNSWPGFGTHWATSSLWPVLATLLGVVAAIVAALVLQPLSGPDARSVTNYFVAGVALIVITGYLLSMSGTLLFGLQGRNNREESLI